MDGEAERKLIERRGAVREKIAPAGPWDLDSRLEMAMDALRCPPGDSPVKNLSGGNIQKVVLARELSRNPRVILAAQPTRGLDIGATEYVREQLLIERRKGTAIMLISEDLDEILALSDRIAVIYEGRIMDIVPRENATPEKLGLLMAGVHPEDAAVSKAPHV